MDLPQPSGAIHGHSQETDERPQVHCSLHGPPVHTQRATAGIVVPTASLKVIGGNYELATVFSSQF